MLRGLAATTILSGLAMPAFAQDQDDAPAIIEPATAVEADEGEDRIVVTGSRLRRSSFDSISPLQNIDADASRLSGLTTAAEFITQSPVVAGAQLDGSINAGSPTAAVEGVPAGGVGATNVALRGLGPERTLVLLNSRRLAPAGVRGAPVAPDINLIPSLMVENIELLTDGASSIYGADAVAGVVNIILDKDFEGFEVAGQFTAPEDDGGDVQQVGLKIGSANDRGQITFAAEYFHRRTVLVGDRDYNDCLRDIEVASTGEIFSTCYDPRPDNAVFIGSQGFVFSTPGTSDFGVPGFSTGAAVEGGNFRTGRTYNLQDEELSTQLLAGTERYNVYTSGEYNFTDEGDHTFYFEALYSERNNVETFTSEQIFPGVPALIPQEIRVNALDGSGNPIPVDPEDMSAGFVQQTVIQTDAQGRPILVDNPLNPFDEDALPVISTSALPQTREADVATLRLVGGFQGDLPFLQDRGWTYDAGVTYDRSYGTATQPILQENAIRESLDTLRLDPDGNLICGLERTSLSFGFLTPQDCVVVDYFNDNLFSTTGGDKSFSEEEQDFLTGRAFNTTEIEQRLFYGLVTGDVLELPGGMVGAAIGVEYRELEIRSLNDIVRTNGLAASEVPDIERDTIGRTNLTEVFAEVELPIHDTLTANVSGRYTDEKNFGDEFTYSGKLQFKPLDWISLRATYGTTFRAPNLREQFLVGQAGTIDGTLDPCLVPLDARAPNPSGPGVIYVPGADQRPQALLDQCLADGADPTTLGLQATTGIPTSTGGSEELKAETSESWTVGASFSQPWTDKFDFDLAVTYWDITIEDTVDESSASGLLSDCYGLDPQQFACDRITRNPGGTVAVVDASFINIGLLETNGIDYVARFGMELGELHSVFDGYDLGLSFTATQTLENIEDQDPNDPDIRPQERAGEIAFPKMSWLATATVERGDFSALWRTRFIGEGEQNPPTEGIATADLSVIGNACGILGYDDFGGCRDVDFVDNYVTHDASLTYNRDTWSVTGGVSNIFAEDPPLIDQGTGPARMNIVVQSGYDLIGRRAFLNFRKEF